MGPRQLPATSATCPGNGVDEFREALEMFRRVGDLTMEAWSLHMLGTALLRNGEVTAARTAIEQAIRHFHAAGDAAGLTLDPRRHVGHRGRRRATCPERPVCAARRAT